MARAKRKTLPQDFDEILRSDDLLAVQRVFERSALDAYGGYAKRTALGHPDAGDDAIRWLLEQGADLEARDGYGATPLIAHAAAWYGKVDLLLELGADVTARDDDGETALHAAVPFHVHNVRTLLDAGIDPLARDDEDRTALAAGLADCDTTSIEPMAEIAALLLAAGDIPDDEMRDDVRRVGARFEELREVFDEESLPLTDAALHRLYELFDVEPVAGPDRHDGVAPIEMPPGHWTEQHEALFAFLVPAMGAAATAQGEAIRITARVVNELDGNGGINWDADFRKMVDTLPDLFGRGTALSTDAVQDAAARVARVRKARPHEGDSGALAKHAVDWMALNPEPIPLGAVPYEW